jgi:hypothetical protein
MKKNDPTPRWPIRLLLVVLGAVMAATGLATIHMGYWWIAQYNTRLGRPGLAPALEFVFWGLIILAIGLIPWPKSKEPKRRR